MSESASIVDADLLPERAEITQITPYLSAGWREHLTTGGGLASRGYALPSPPYRPPPPPADDGLDAITRTTRYLDRHGVTAAVVNPGTAPALSGIANAVMAAELARATNDWLKERWLESDERLHGSILVGPRDGELAAGEVRRLGAQPRMAQIVLAFPPCLLGDRSLYPLYAAAEEFGLPVSLQVGGALAGSNSGPVPAGYPTSYFEYSVDASYGAVPHLVSALVEGIFHRFPGLRLVLSGFGIGWLPSLLWRLDTGFGDPANAKLGALPSETVRKHVRLTTRGLETPDNSEHLWNLISVVNGSELVVYASGDLRDDTDPLLGSIPPELRSGVLRANASSFLRLSGSQLSEPVGTV